MHAPGSAPCVRPVGEHARSAAPAVAIPLDPMADAARAAPSSLRMRERLHSAPRRGYAAFAVISRNALLGSLWLVACLPLITVVPATAALFAGVHDHAHAHSHGAVVDFVRNLRGSLRPTLILQAVYTLAGVGMIVNIHTYPLLAPAVALAFRTMTLGIALILVVTAPYVLSLLSTYSMPLTRTAGTALLLAIGRPLHTLACLALVSATVISIDLAPPVIVVVVPLAARGLQRITGHALTTTTTTASSEGRRA